MFEFKDYMYINDGINPLRHQKRVINGGMAIVSGDDDNEIEYENSDDEDKSLDALLRRKQKYEIEGIEVEEPMEIDISGLDSEISRLSKIKDDLTDEINKANQNIEKRTRLLSMPMDDEKREVVLKGIEDLRGSIETKTEELNKTDAEIDKLSQYSYHLKFNTDDPKKVKEIARLNDNFYKTGMLRQELMEKRIEIENSLKRDGNSPKETEKLNKILENIDRQLAINSNNLFTIKNSLKKHENKVGIVKRKVKLPNTYDDHYKYVLLRELRDLKDIHDDVLQMENRELALKIRSEYNRIVDELKIYDKLNPVSIYEGLEDIYTRTHENPIYNDLREMRSKGERGELNELIFERNPKMLSIIDKDKSILYTTKDPEAFNRKFIDDIGRLGLTETQYDNLLNAMNIDFVKDKTIWETKAFYDKNSYDDSEDNTRYTQAKFKGTKNFYINDKVGIDFDFIFNADGLVQNIKYDLFNISNQKVIASGNLLRDNPEGYKYFILENNKDALQYFNVSKNYNSYILPRLTDTNELINISNGKFRKFPKSYLINFDKRKKKASL